MIVTKKVYLVARKWLGMSDGFSLRVSEVEAQSDENFAEVGLCEIDVDFVVDDNYEKSLAGHEIAALEAIKQKTLADAQVKANAIDERIQSLLAIESK